MSSTKLPKLTMNGTLSSASRTFSAFGVPKTGFASSSRSSFADCSAASQGLGAGDWGLDARREEDPARLPNRAEQCVERVDRERVKQAVGVRQRRAADDRDRRRPFGQLARQALDALRGDAGDLLDLRGRVVGEAARPAVDGGAGAPRGIAGAQLARDHRVRQAEREDAFGARLDRHPFVGAGAGQRHARLDLREPAAHAAHPPAASARRRRSARPASSTCRGSRRRTRSRSPSARDRSSAAAPGQS